MRTPVAFTAETTDGREIAYLLKEAREIAMPAPHVASQIQPFTWHLSVGPKGTRDGQRGYSATTLHALKALAFQGEPGDALRLAILKVCFQAMFQSPSRRCLWCGSIP